MNDLAVMHFEADAQWISLSDKGRRAVRDKLRVIDRILKHEGRRGDIVAREAKAHDVGGSTIRSWVSKFENSGGDWKELVDWRAERHDDMALPADFLDFVKMLCEDNQRNSNQAFKKLMALYHGRATHYQKDKDSLVIPLWPGYTDPKGFHYRPEPLPSTGRPKGWSRRNLYRHQPTKLELTLARLGPIAAAEYQQMVFTTRVGLKPGQYYVFDDRWLDIKTMTDGMNKPVRVIELSAGDVFSGKTVSYDLFPLEETLDDNGKAKREQIKSIHMLLLLVDLLCHKGFHKDGVTLMVELGTAAIPHALEMLLCRLSGGQTEEVMENGKLVERIVKHGLIRVNRGGVQGGKSFAGGFPTLGSGNFRYKAGWESTHALKHSVAADLPGQVGKHSRDAYVEEDHGRDAHTRRMIEAALSARPEVLKEFMKDSPYLPFRDLYWAVDRTFHQIHADPNHHLEGWKEAGLSRCEYRLKMEPDSWLPVEELEAYPNKDIIKAWIDATPWASREQRLSRQEAHLRGAEDLIRLPLHCVPLILGENFSKLRPDLCRDRVVTDANKIQVQVKAIGDDPMWFSSKCTRPNKSFELLTPGKTYRTMISPLNTKMLFVSDTEGRYIGTCNFERIQRGDEAALQNDFGRVAAENKLLTNDLVRRTRLRNRRETAQMKRTNALFAGGPITEAERQLAADREARAAAAASAPASKPVAIQAALPDDDDEIPDFNSFIPQPPQP